MSNRLFPAVTALAAVLASSCVFDPVDTGDAPVDFVAEFELFWQTVDREYVCLSRSDVDWDALYQQYSPVVDTVSSQLSLMYVLNDMLLHFQDTELAILNEDPLVPAPGPWPFEPEPNYDMEVLWTYIEPAGFEWFQTDYWGWCLFGDVLYVMVEAWNPTMSNTQLKDIIAEHPELSAMIVDTRMNAGSGPDTRLGELARVFNDEVRIGYYSTARNGPEPGDLCDPVPRYTPRTTNCFDKPVFVLFGECCGGSSEKFACMVSEIPYVTTLGDTTSAISSAMGYYALPAGWAYAIPDSTRIRADGTTWVRFSGVPPDVFVEADEEDFAAGVDPVLEYALGLARGARGQTPSF